MQKTNKIGSKIRRKEKRHTHPECLFTLAISSSGVQRTLWSLQLGREAGDPSAKGVKQAVPYRTGREAWYLPVSTKKNQIKNWTGREAWICRFLLNKIKNQKSKAVVRAPI